MVLEQVMTLGLPVYLCIIVVRIGISPSFESESPVVRGRSVAAMSQEPISTTMGPMTAFLVEIRCTHSRKKRLGAPIIEEAEHRPFGIRSQCGHESAKRIGWERARRLGRQRHFSCKPRQ